MAGKRDRFVKMTLDELTDVIASSEPGSVNSVAAATEIQRRQMLSQIEANKATEETAIYARKSAGYMKWSVVVLAISAAVTAALTAVQAFSN